MGIFDKEIVLESLGTTGQDQYTKNVPHYAPAGRSVAGSYVMALGLMAAYNTVPVDFQVHHITAQFVQPGAKDTTLTFDVNRSSDRKNNAARVVFISQLGTRISMMTIDFIRRPILDGLSLNYQTQFPEGIEPPDDEIDDMKFFGRGLLHGQGLGRVMNSDRIEENKTRQWLKSGSISSQAGGKIHHAGLAFLTDQFILDTPARLQNLQLGLGEAEVGTSQKDSPYNKRSTRQSSNMADFRTSAPSDFRVLTTLNHTIHFCDPGAVKADEWILMEASTTFAHGGRVLIHSKLFARDGKILAVCTQEGYYRVKKEAGHKIQQSNL